MSESEGSNLESLISTPNSSPFQQVPANESHPPKTLYSYNTLHSNGNNPHLVILVQPQELFRFRYKSEREGGTHGYLQGDHLAPDLSKTCPTVELRNYKGAAIIKCQVYQHNKNVEHPHTLYEESRGDEEPKAEVSEKGYIVCFKGLGIIHTAKKEVPGQMYIKLQRSLTEEEFETLDERQLREWCKNIDLNRVRLRFSAHDPATDKEICSVFSRTILNMKSAETNVLRICRSSRPTGRAGGGDDVMLFVEKVIKGNIRVNFFEKNSNGERGEWLSQANILEVHRQYGICFRTPAYKDPDVTSYVDVWFELQRETDGRRSEPMAFRYSPEPHQLLRKRARKQIATSVTLENGIIIEPIVIPGPITIQNQVSAPSEDIMNNQLPDLFPTLEEDLPQPQVGDDQILDMFINLEPNIEFDNFRNSHSTLISQLCDDPFMFDTPQSDSPNVQLASDMPHRDSRIERHRSDNDGSFKNEENLPMHIEFNMDFGYENVREECLKEEIESEDCSFNYEDSLQMQTLLTEICDLKRKKLREWYEEVTDKLEKLFDTRSATGETILHLLVAHDGAALRLVAGLAAAVGRRDLLDERDCRGRAPLHYAVMLDKPDIVVFLIQKGCDPRLGDARGDTALHHAAQSGSTLPALLGAIAATCGHDKDRIRRVLDHTNYELQTPVFIAVERQRPESLRLLLQAGCSRVASDLAGRGPLHVAVELDRPDLVRMLLECEPELCLRDEIAGYLAAPRRPWATALQAACGGPARAHSAEIAALLLRHGADPMSSYASAPPAWRLARRRGGALWAALRRRLAHRGETDAGADTDTPSDDSASSSDDEFHSADEGDAETSENDIASQLEAVEIGNNES